MGYTEYYVDNLLGNDANVGTSPGTGNAWATIQHALNTVTTGSGGPVCPRINVLDNTSAHPYVEALVANTNAGYWWYPICVEGYGATPGDYRGTNSRVWLRPTAIAQVAAIYVTKNFIQFRNFDLLHAVTDKRGIWLDACYFNLFANMKVQGPGEGLHLNGTEGTTVDGCLFTACGSANYTNVISHSGDTGTLVARTVFTALNAAAANCVFFNYNNDAVYEKCVFHDLACACFYFNAEPYSTILRQITGYNLTGSLGFINANGNPLSSLDLQDFALSNVTGPAIYSSGSTQCARRVAHGIVYNVNGHSDTWAHMISASVFDNAEDMTFANPFGTYPALSAAAKSHGIPLPDAETDYIDLGAVQSIDGAAAQLAADTAAVTAGQADIKTTRTILGVTGSLDMTLWTLTSTINWPAQAQVLHTGTPFYGITGSLLDGTASSATARSVGGHVCRR